jgi:hypothetical protein
MTRCEIRGMRFLSLMGIGDGLDLTKYSPGVVLRE